MLRTSLRYILFDTKFACRRKRLTPRVVSPHSGLFSLGRCQIDPFQDNCSYACLIFSTAGWNDVRCRAVRRIYRSLNNVCAYAPTTRSAKFNCTRFTLSLRGAQQNNRVIISPFINLRFSSCREDEEKQVYGLNSDS